MRGLEGIEWAVLPDGKDYFAGPLLAGMCKYESLEDGTLDLAAVADMNDMLIARNINQRLYEKYLADNRERDG